MKVSLKHKEKMVFEATTDGGHKVFMDARPPVGSDQAPLPKHLLLSAVAGCTAMDTASLMRKYKQQMDSFEIEIDGELTEGSHPITFKKIELVYKFSGPIEREKALEAVRLSMTKFCGVSAMVSKAVPIHYTVQINAEVVGEGQAQFP